MASDGSPLHHVAPYPRAEKDATADTLIRYYSAHGLLYDTLATALSTGTTDRERYEHGHSITQAGASFAVVLLLVTLKRTDPDKADRAAYALWKVGKDRQQREWLEDWVADHDIDPTVIDTIAAQVEKRIREAGPR